jgi:outer membrane protein
VLLCIVASGAAYAAEPPAPSGQYASVEQIEANWASYALDQKFPLLEQLLITGRADVAARLLPQVRPVTAADKKQLRFYTAMVAKAQGRPREAIPIFRELLAADPHFARVRLELARTLFEVQDDEAAKHHFELVLGGSAAQPDLSNTVKEYLSALSSRRRWEFSSYVSIAPSTNLNQGSSNKVIELNGLPFVLSDNNQKKSGIGVVTGFQGGYNLPLTGSLDLVTTAGLHVKRYSQKDFNDTLTSASVGPRWRFDAGHIGVYGTAEKRWMADADLSTAFGGLLAASYRLGVQDVVHGDIGCSQKRYSTMWFANDLSYQDGHTCTLSARFEHSLDVTSYLRFLGGAADERAVAAHLSNRSWNAGAGVHRELPWGVSLYVQGLYTKRDYDGIFPGALEARRDQRLDLSANLTKRDLEVFGLAPMVQYTYTKNDSNVGFYQYDAHGVSVTLTKRF